MENGLHIDFGDGGVQPRNGRSGNRCLRDLDDLGLLDSLASVQETLRMLALPAFPLEAC
jgi:hypothetical protein